MNLVVDLYVLDAFVLGLAGLVFALGVLVRTVTHVVIQLHIPRRLTARRAKRELKHDLERLERESIHPD